MQNYLTNVCVQKNVIERQKLKLYTNLRSHDIFVKNIFLCDTKKNMALTSSISTDNNRFIHFEYGVNPYRVDKFI